VSVDLREDLRARLGEDAPARPTVDPLVELEQRRQELAPEALAGDKTASAELERIDQEISDARRRDELRELADLEEAARAQAAELELAEGEREQNAAQKAAVDVEIREVVGLVEQRITALVEAIAELRRLDNESQVLGHRLSSNHRHPRTVNAVRDRLARQLRSVNMQDLDGVLGAAALKPLPEELYGGEKNSEGGHTRVNQLVDTPDYPARADGPQAFAEPASLADDADETDTWKQPFIAELQRGSTARTAAKVAGVSQATAYRHRGADPSFAAKWKKALGAAIRAHR
jgi:hypothetical protein